MGGIELPAQGRRHPLDHVNQEPARRKYLIEFGENTLGENICCKFIVDIVVQPGTPAGGEDEDDDEEHLDDLPPALVDLVGLVDGVPALLLEEGALAGGAVQAAPRPALLRQAASEGGGGALRGCNKEWE